MDGNLLIPSIALALTVLFFMAGIFFVMRGRGQQALRKRLQKSVSPGNAESQEVYAAIARDVESAKGNVTGPLAVLPGASRYAQLLVQADSSLQLGSFYALKFAVAFVTVAVLYTVTHVIVVALAVGLLMGMVPDFVMRRKKLKRVAMFEKQFPDALDMLTGALRAGLAFSGAVQVVSEEAPNPVSKEFTLLFEENRLGLDMREALKNMAARVDSAELRLFVTAVILQRETGGNLTEILEGTAYVIRDRFRILGDVKTMTAQARFSGMILTVLPLGLVGVIMVLAPDYLLGLVKDPVGPYLIGTAVTLQLVGYAIMHRIVSIKV